MGSKEVSTKMVQRKGSESSSIKSCKPRDQEYTCVALESRPSQEALEGGLGMFGSKIC